MLRKLLTFLMIASPVLAQNVRKDDIALQTITQLTSAGTATYVKPIASAQIDVCSATGSGTPCSPHVSICSSETDVVCSLPNPFNADVNGNYGFWLPSGLTYQVSITGVGVNSKLITYTLGPSKPGPKFQQFTSNGTFTIPSNVTAVKVTVVGGGGAGGGSNGPGATLVGAGGASGGVAIKWLTGLTPGGTLVVTVGLGGAGVSASAGAAGAASSVASGTQSITTISAGGGGGGGAGAVSLGGGSPGGSVSGGDLNLGGNAGGAASGTSTAAGVAGNGGPSIFGGSQNGTFSTAGFPANAPGAGGSGSGANVTGAGGNGANGIVIFEWVN